MCVTECWLQATKSHGGKTTMCTLLEFLDDKDTTGGVKQCPKTVPQKTCPSDRYILLIPQTSAQLDASDMCLHNTQHTSCLGELSKLPPFSVNPVAAVSSLSDSRTWFEGGGLDTFRCIVPCQSMSTLAAETAFLSIRAPEDSTVCSRGMQQPALCEESWGRGLAYNYIYLMFTCISEG